MIIRQAAELLRFAFSEAVLYAGPDAAIIVLIYGINSNSSKYCMGCVEPRPIRSAVSTDLADGLVTIEFLLLAFFKLLTLSVGLIPLPVSSYAILNCKYGGNKSLCCLRRSKFSIALSFCILANMNSEFVVPNKNAQRIIANDDCVLPICRGTT